MPIFLRDDVAWVPFKINVEFTSLDFMMRRTVLVPMI